jgi:hypothetical protein
LNSSNESRPWTARDEENLLFEIAEDNRLRAIGIDPDAAQHVIVLELKKRSEAIREKRRQWREGI